ncbi:MAG: DUF2478 domain-containing protein [Acidobacteria bacterium]|nr:MAG: DUF2478 domain-containing protein [Acidobacteriota bacterium]
MSICDTASSAKTIAAIGGRAAGREDIWAKAAVVGGLWASIEIILGSFLHNLRVPMSGTILSAIGAALLVATYRKWSQPGLLWRAGAVCALMKSISPSAVILGPMVGIFMESLLLEIGIRVFLGSRLGCILGAGLAVSWTLIQRAVNLLITFGADLVQLYLRLYDFAARSLGVERIGALDLVLILFLIHFMFGVVAGIVGLLIGARANRLPAVVPGASRETVFRKTVTDKPTGQRFRLVLLPVHIAVLVTALMVLDRIPIWLSAGVVTVYVGLVGWRYPGPVRRLGRPFFWVQIVLLTILSGLLLGSIASTRTGTDVQWSTAGLLTGCRMSLRAALVVIGFSAICVELRNPVLLGWFYERRLKSVLAALEGGFAALPMATAELTKRTASWRDPIGSAAGVIQRLDDWLAQTRAPAGSRGVFVVTGVQQSGKTTLVTNMVARLQQAGVRVGGILAPGHWTDNRRSAFDLVDIRTGVRIPLCSLDPVDTSVTLGPFHFSLSALESGNRLLESEILSDSDLVVVDEVGPLELQGLGWSPALSRLRGESQKNLLLVVRAGLFERVLQQWQLGAARVWAVGEAPASEIAAEIALTLQPNYPEARCSKSF